MSYVERRVGCCRKIALRHHGHLSRRRFRQLMELTLRILIVYSEAFNAHKKNRRWQHALRTLFVCPFSLATDMLSAILFGANVGRRHVLVICSLWLWVVGTAFAYLYQFKHLAQPIWHLLKGLFRA